MELIQKQNIWNLIQKYDGILDGFSDSLSKLLQNEYKDEDYLNIYSNFRNIDKNDVNLISDIIQPKLIMILNK